MHCKKVTDAIEKRHLVVRRGVGNYGDTSNDNVSLDNGGRGEPIRTSLPIIQ
jgi:hypothetical protein